MFLASPNDQKYPRYPLVLKFNVTLARPLHLVIPYFFEWKFLSDVRRLYLYGSKRNLRSDVDGLAHTKQLLNLLCIVYLPICMFIGVMVDVGGAADCCGTKLLLPVNAAYLGNEALFSS